LFAIDDAMADVVVRSTQPALGAIKLAWWRERLEALDQGAVPDEPRLQAVARELLPRGLAGAAIARLEVGWATLLEENPVADIALERGRQLFALAGRLLCEDPPEFLGLAGRLYAAAGLVRRKLAPEGALVITDIPAVPRRLRALTGMAALAKRDLQGGGAPFEPEGTPGRAWTLLRHRFTGRI